MTTISRTASRLNVNAGRWPPRCSPKNGLLKSAPSTETLLWMPRWPPMLRTSPSGPCVTATLGVSVVRLRKLRPLFGKPLTVSASSAVDDCERVGSTSNASALTVTAVSWVAVRCMTNGTSSVWPTFTDKFDFVTGVKPTARAESSYIPSGMSVATKTPLSLATMVREKLVSVFRSVMVAGTGAPLASLAVPRTTPVVACACARITDGISTALSEANRVRARGNAANKWRRFTMPPLVEERPCDAGGSRVEPARATGTALSPCPRLPRATSPR